jgi:hypothetical protein
MTEFCTYEAKTNKGGYTRRITYKLVNDLPYCKHTIGGFFFQIRVVVIDIGIRKIFKKLLRSKSLTRPGITYKLVNDLPYCKHNNIHGYKFKGEVFEESISQTGVTH